jgi:hypothetical protein
MKEEPGTCEQANELYLSPLPLTAYRLHWKPEQLINDKASFLCLLSALVITSTKNVLLTIPHKSVPSLSILVHGIIIHLYAQVKIVLIFFVSCLSFSNHTKPKN